MNTSTKIGFANIGNTCFLNVVLQGLRLAPPMAAIFLNETEIPLREDSKKKEMVTAFQTLFKDLWRIEPPADATPTMVPRGFFQALTNIIRETDDDWYHHGQQADAAEALQYILDSLHDGMYRRVRMQVSGEPANKEEESQLKAIQSWATFFGKEYSPIVDWFNGQTQICIECTNCRTISERFEPWLMLKAPIPGSEGAPVPSMEDCLKHAFLSEKIDDYACDTCKSKQKATITNRISRLPSVVILSLKRFTNTGKKVRGTIAWNLDSLDFAPQMAFSRNPFSRREINTEYETFAVIDHHGSTNGGHYVMHAKQDGKWIEYDDSNVTPSSPERVVNQDSYIAMLIPKRDASVMNTQFQSMIQEFRKREKPAPIAEA